MAERKVESRLKDYLTLLLKAFCFRFRSSLMSTREGLYVPFLFTFYAKSIKKYYQ